MKNNLGLFTAITLLLLIAAVVSSWQRAPQTELKKAPLFADLLENINSVGSLEIRNAKHQTTISRQGDGWVVQNRDNYPARFDQVKQAVISIAELQVLEGKTKNPALYTRLDVEGTTEAPGKSTLLKLNGSDDNQLAALVVGKPRTSANHTSPSLYVRKPHEERALLVEGSLEIPADPRQWMEDRVLDIKASSINAVSIRQADGSQLDLQRDDKGAPDMRDIPTGFKLKSKAILNSLFTALEELRFEDVMARSSFRAEGVKTVSTYHSIDGIIITATTYLVKKDYYTALDFAYQPLPGEDPEATEKQAYVEKISALTGAWTYRLPSFKGKLMSRDKQGLLREDPDQQ